MPKKRDDFYDASHLLNFRTKIPVDLPSTTNSEPIRSNRKEKKKTYQQLEAERQERETREKFSSFFFLHSSPRHAFVISRMKQENKLKNKELGADSILDWDRVKIVKVMVPIGGSYIDEESSLSTCSICLDSLIAPRTTECGHLFCLPCILRHLHSESYPKLGSSHQFIAKCPCCFHYCAQKDLRPVELISVKDIRCGSTGVLEFRKIFREKNSLSPYIPCDTGKSDSDEADSIVKIHVRIGSDDIPSVNDADACFSRYNYVDMDHYQDHLLNDIQNLEKELKNISSTYIHMPSLSESTRTACQNDIHFITMAIQAVNIELEKAIAQKPEEDKVENVIHLKQKGNIREIVPFSCFTKDWFLNEQDDAASEGRGTREFNPSSGTMYHDDSSFQLYQSVDGQLCFLSGFNLNCLAYEFSGKQSGDEISPMEWKPPFPDTIKAPVVDVEKIHLTTDVRKRMKCFSHLPLYTDITIVELDLRQYLSTKTTNHFKKEMDSRQKKRQHRKETEKRAENEAKRAEEDRIAALKYQNERIDPTDPFFTSDVAIENTKESFDDSDFVSFEASSKTLPPEQEISDDLEKLSFRSVCASNGRYPSLLNFSAFPPLSGSILSEPKQKHSKSKDATTNVKKEKNVNALQFSTGGRRGSYK